MRELCPCTARVVGGVLISLVPRTQTVLYGSAICPLLTLCASPVGVGADVSSLPCCQRRCAAAASTGGANTANAAARDGHGADWWCQRPGCAVSAAQLPVVWRPRPTRHGHSQYLVRHTHTHQQLGTRQLACVCMVARSGLLPRSPNADPLTLIPCAYGRVHVMQRPVERRIW